MIDDWPLTIQALWTGSSAMISRGDSTRAINLSTANLGRLVLPQRMSSKASMIHITRVGMTLQLTWAPYRRGTPGKWWRPGVGSNNRWRALSAPASERPLVVARTVAAGASAYPNSWYNQQPNDRRNPEQTTNGVNKDFMVCVLCLKER